MMIHDPGNLLHIPIFTQFNQSLPNLFRLPEWQQMFNCRFWFSVSPYPRPLPSSSSPFSLFSLTTFVSTHALLAGLLDRPWAIPRTSLLFNQRARSHGSGFHNRRRKETGCSGYVNPRYLYSLASSFCIVGHKPPHWVKVEFGQTVDLNPPQGYPAVNNSHEL